MTDSPKVVVMGAGLPRTGTLSLYLALSKLTNSKCYHMRSVMEGGKEHSQFWNDALNRQITKEVL